jgi:hypothetical protein
MANVGLEVGILGVSGLFIGTAVAQEEHPSVLVFFVSLLTFFGSFFLLARRIWTDDI